MRPNIKFEISVKVLTAVFWGPFLFIMIIDHVLETSVIFAHVEGCLNNVKTWKLRSSLGQPLSVTFFIPAHHQVRNLDDIRLLLMMMQMMMMQMMMMAIMNTISGLWNQRINVIRNLDDSSLLLIMIYNDDDNCDDVWNQRSSGSSPELGRCWLFAASHSKSRLSSKSQSCSDKPPVQSQAWIQIGIKIKVEKVFEISTNLFCPHSRATGFNDHSPSIAMTMHCP